MGTVITVIITVILYDLLVSRYVKALGKKLFERWTS
jgi:hypothetical protein